MVFGQNVVNIIINAQDKFSKVFNKATLSLQSFQKSALGAAAVGAGIAIGFGKALQASIDFESAMTKSLAIMENMSDLQNEMSDAAREMAKVTTFSATEAADSYFFLASAGLDAKASIKALPVVAQFAQAGMFDMALATDLLTDAQSALGLTIRNDAVKNMKNMIKISDVLVKANTLANASVQQFSEALTSEAGAALKSYNKSVEEGVAVLAAMADQGVKGQKAGTDLSRIMRLLSKAALDNSFELKELGIQIFDSSGEMENFANIIGDMEQAFDGMSDKQRTAALDSIGFTARVQGVILPLLGTSDAIRKYEEALKDAGGTSQEVAENQLTSLAAQIKLTKSAFKDIGIEIGDRLAPFLEKVLIPALDKLIQFWDNLSPKMQDSILIFAGVTAAVTLLAGAVAILTLVMSPWLLILGAIIIAITLFIVFFKDLVKIVQKGIIAIVFGFEFLRDTLTIIFSNIKNKVINTWNSIINIIKTKIQQLFNFIRPILELINTGSKKLGFGNAFDLTGIQTNILQVDQFKGELIDIDALRAQLAQERIDTANILAERVGVSGTRSNTTVNIENVNGIDGVDVATAMQDILDDKMLTN